MKNRHIKAITIRQPFAWAVFHGKAVENRNWATRYRAPLVIHAGRSRASLGARLPRRLRPKPADLHFGALVGVVRLVDCVPYSEAVAGNPFTAGPWCWLLEDARAFVEPVPCSGRRGLWEVDVTGPLLRQLQLCGARL
jgi:hypothetical protein